MEEEEKMEEIIEEIIEGEEKGIKREKIIRDIVEFGEFKGSEEPAEPKPSQAPKNNKDTVAE